MRARALLAVATFSAFMSFAAAALALPVHIQRHLAISHNVHVTFRAHPLRNGGYYYAVIVLRRYRKYTRSSPPPCSTSSNMLGTNYGYPRADGTVALTLTPARSFTHHWCREGSYDGAIYAVPEPPPCEGRYPCRSEPYEEPHGSLCPGSPIPCFGVVIRPRQWEYSDAAPLPIASGASIIGRFAVKFP